MTDLARTRKRDGRCQGCGTAIPLERLQALPTVSLCRSCQHAEEADRRAALDAAGAGSTGHTPVALDIVDEWGRGSFPASDPPANW